MVWKVQFDSSAERALRKLPLVVQRRIVRALDELASDPYASRNVKALQGVEGYRLRVGDYRVIYTLAKGVLIIQVIRIANRRDAY